MTDWRTAAQADLTAWQDLPHSVSEKGSNSPQNAISGPTGTEVLRDLWNAHTGRFETFYERRDVGEAYILDLSAWHASGSVSRWFRIAQKYLSGSVLDFGAGIGTYSLIAAEAGHETEACETNTALREYIQWRAERHGLKISVTKEPWREKYDTIIAVDVVEHMPDPLVFADYLADLTKSGSRVLLTYTFHDSQGMHPMHLGPEHARPFCLAMARNFSVLSPWDWPQIWIRE